MTAGGGPAPAPLSPPIPLTLVIGPGADAREAAIARELSAAPPRTDAHPHPPAVILEGLASGAAPLDAAGVNIQLARIAPGCLCCTGNVVLRVTLNRLLRQRPGRIYIGVARGEHLDQLRSWLQSEPYDQLLRLTPDLVAH